MNIGFVYEEIAAIQSDLQQIMKSFQHKNLLVTEWKVARDEDGDEWIEGEEAVDLAQFKSGYFGIISWQGKLFNTIENMKIRMNFQREKDFQGFVFSFEEQAFSAFHIDEVEAMLLSFIKHMAALTNAQYIYCDDDAEVEVHPAQIDKVNNTYAIIYWPKSGEVIKNSWKIDGYTLRESLL